MPVSGTINLADFDELAREFAQNKGREYNRQVEWWDCYYKQPHLAERPQYKQYQISDRTGPVQYDRVQKTVERPGYTYEHWFHNSQETEVLKGEIDKTQKLTSSFTWGFEEAIKIGLKVVATAGLPTLFGASAEYTTELNFKATQSKTETKEETYSMKNTITIPPKKSVKALWVINELDMDITWNADIYIDGWIAIWFREKYNGHWLWFYRINQLAQGAFRPNGSGLIFRSGGVFTGIRGLSSTLKTFEYPLQEDKNKHALADAVPFKTTLLSFYKPDDEGLRHGD